MAPFNASTLSGEHLEVNVVPQFERLDEPFEIADGVVIPAGDYRFTRYRAEAQTSSSRPWRVGTTVWFGTFYTGSLTQVAPFVTLASPSGRLELSASAEGDYAKIPQGDFAVRLWQTTAVYALTPDMVASTNVQYDSDSRDLGVNARFRWSPRADTDLFLVWNRGWERPLGEPGWRSLDGTQEEISLKVRYAWRR